ncbi:MAG: nucleotidyl transferase AbiEii/AbiGii toxin family protein [Candidatus Kerfeldbacteria bacterium]|nr:nucleotidyl transferase AbiEii/AbiGii toxin family protein [Candidatus Kerfeldbacteria bacterium]
MLTIEKHKSILIRILKDIYTDNTLGPLLGFKGGTAAFLFYDLPRFSVDLDFDLLDASTEDEVFEKVGTILSGYGKVKGQRKKYYTLFFELSYADADQNIKVEISRRSFESKYEVVNYFGISMNVMVKEDMFANKIMALYERMERANRDIFDVWFFLQNNWPINVELVEKRMELPFQEFLAKCIRKLEKISSRSILAGMGELLDAKQKAWAKAKLKQETLFLLKVLLDQKK